MITTITEIIKEDEVFLRPMGDIHLDDENFTPKEEKKLKEDIYWVKEHPNARVILNGDIFNTATRVSKTSPHTSRRYQDGVIQFAIDIFKPIANQIIEINDGNHEFKLLDYANYSILNEFCQRLSTPDRKIIYSGDSCLLFLKVGKPPKHGTPIKWRDLPNRTAQTYVGFIQHTTGGGNSVGGKANRVDMERQIVSGCDFYIGGHTHLLGATKPSIFLPNIQKCSYTEIEQLNVSSGSYLGHGGYSMRGQLKPLAIGSPIMKFKSKIKEIKVEL